VFVLVAVGLAAGCGGGNEESSKPAAPPKTSGNPIYPHAIAPQKVTCAQFLANSPKAAAFVDNVGKASGATNDHAYVAVQDICLKSKGTVRPYHLAVKKLRSGEYK